MKILLAFALLLGIATARADTLPIINGQGTASNMNVKANPSGAFSSRIVSCDASNPDNCAPVDTTLGLSVNLTNLNSQGSTTSGQMGLLGLAAVTTSGPVYVAGQSSPLSLDPSGNLRVVLSGSGGGTASNFGAPFPASGTALGAKLGSNMVNLTADGSGNLLVGQSIGTSLHMVCDSGCSPSNYPADGSAFLAGTTPQLPAGGFFQTTATANPLTNGQMGAAQMTAQRAVFSNLRNASGAEVGVAAIPLQVSLTNTGSNASALLVSFAANQSINNAQVNGVTISTGAGASSTGSQRVTVSGDTSTISGSAPGTAGTASANVLSVQGIASMTALTVAQATGTNLHIVCDSGCSSSTAPADETAFSFGTTPQSPVGGVFQTTATSNALTTGQMGTFQVTATRALFTNLRNAAGTEVGTAGTPLQVSLANTAANGTAVAVSLAANQSINEAQINGVTPLMGAGASGTGAQRVTQSQDTTTIAGAAPGTAGTASANVVTIQGVASMTKLLVTPDPNASVNLAQVGGSTISQGHGAAAAAIRVELPTDGTGVVKVATDTGTIAGSAPGTAGTASANVVTVQGVASMTAVAVQDSTIAAQGSTTSGQSGRLALGAVTTGAPTYTTAQSNPISLDTAGNLRVNCATGCTTAAVTAVALDVATVTSGGVAVSALSAGHRTGGGWIQNPPTATVNLCINEVGTASGTTSSGSTTCVTPGQTYTLIPAAGAVSVISSDSAHPFAGYGLTSGSGSHTIVALDVATVTTGSTAVTALSAGHRTVGGWIQNPPTATVNLCINEIGTASGTSSSGSTICVTPGQGYSLIPAAGAVSVISSDSAHPFSGYGVQ